MIYIRNESYTKPYLLDLKFENLILVFKIIGSEN